MPDPSPRDLFRILSSIRNHAQKKVGEQGRSPTPVDIRYLTVLLKCNVVLQEREQLKTIGVVPVLLVSIHPVSCDEYL